MLTRKSHFLKVLCRSSFFEPVLGVKMAASSSAAVNMTDLMPDLAIGPLTPYRKQASFDWRTLKLAIDGEDMIRFKNRIWSVCRGEEFVLSPVTLPLDEQRRLAHRRMNIIKAKNIMTMEEIFADPRVTAAWTEALFMYDVSCAIKYSLGSKMFTNVIRGMGSSRHEKFIEASDNAEIVGSFALTEVAHGSNAKGMQTTATYDVKTKEFVLNSASFEAAKCWVGCLGKTATHSVVYAKLITPDGTNHGLHAFVVPIRCHHTLTPYPGVVVGDIGEKIALNGVDNGFVMFIKYRIPAENLLNKLGDVDENGNYVTPIKDPSKRFGASLGILSGGRVHISGMSTNQIQKAIIVAIRYSAVRKQFGPEDSDEEFSVLEYQQQQFRQIPYLAVAYAVRIFSNWIAEAHTSLTIASVIGDKSEDTSLKGMEMHALSSAIKPAVSWLARDGIQVCRETCGGHGYLKASGLGEMRNENDGSCTYEGENGILIQQTSNWLLGLWKSLQSGDTVKTPYNTANFLNDFKKMSSKYDKSKPITDPEALLSAYRWLVLYTLRKTADKAQKLSKSGKSPFTVRNETQAYYAASLSIIYAEHAMLNNFFTFASKVEDQNCKQVLLKLVSLFGAWSLEKHLGTLYMSEYFSGNMGQVLRDSIIDLCASIKPEAVSLVDAFAPPDFILNSVLGNSNGFVYQNLQTSIFTYPGSLSRPEWWRDVVSKTPNSKL